MAEGKCCSAKCLLIFVNVCTALIGAGFFVSGAVLRFSPKIVSGYLDLEALAERLPDFAEYALVRDVDDGKVKDSVAEYTVFGDLSIALMALGAFVLFTGLLGMCGSCCANKCMLVMYLIIVILGVLGQALIIAAFSTNLYIDGVRSYLKDGLKKDYEGIDDYSIKGVLWNYVMLGYDCCGLDGGDDFDDSKWDNTRLMLDPDTGNTTEVTLLYPVACCKSKGHFPNKIKPKNETCALYPDKENNDFNRGCWEKLKKDTKKDTLTFVVVLGIFLFIQILCAILAICIISNIRKDKSSNYE